MRILLFCAFGLPDSCADATRVINFAKMLNDLGYSSEVLGVRYQSYSNAALSGEYDGIKYEMLNAKSWSGFKAYKRTRALNKDISAYLSKKTDSESYDIIILSGVYYDFSHVFFKYAKKTGAKIVINALEWYDKSNVQFIGLRGKINFVKNRIALKKIFVKAKNILAISSLLDRYYKERNCNTVTIPTVIDMKEYENYACFRVGDSSNIHIAYAGNPGRKDFVRNSIVALSLLSEKERARIRLDFYGPSEKQLYSGLEDSIPDEYKENIICHGKIPYAEVKKKISEADFTVLLRPNKRYANAGFPTKVGESMACGTPVIANLTSDLSKYVIDGKTGIVCRDETPEACADAFRRALALTKEECEIMRACAFDMAKNAFDYRNYEEALNEFLKNAK